MTTTAVWNRITELSYSRTVTISPSGGNPAIQPLGGLITLGRKEGYRFALETQGSLAKDWFADLDVLTLSPKPPSSGMTTDWQRLAECVEAAGPETQTVLKVVVFDEADYAFARDVSDRYPHLSCFLQPGNHTPPAATDTDATIDMTGIMERMRWLVDRVTSDRWYAATVLPQLHTMIWGNLRGV